MRSLQWLLLISVLVIATCGLIYELIAGTLASYLLGDSVTQFSTIIGVYLFSMGIGSWLSRFFENNLISWFIRIEILVGLIGGFSSSILFLSFEYVASFRILLYFLISLTGILVGLEIPLLMRVLNGMKIELRDMLSKVFSFDYMGALVASVAFPLILVPQLGLVRTSFFFGMLNVLIAVVITYQLTNEIRGRKLLRTIGIFSFLLLFTGFILANRIMDIAESSSYSDNIIYSKTTKYQRVVITRSGEDLRLFLNGNLQFSSMDEYRYHEALVHPSFQTSHSIENVLILGGGDGLALREVLKYAGVKRADIVDLDGGLTDMFTTSAILTSLNRNSFKDPRATVVNEDAFMWIKSAKTLYDVIIIDFPDPSNYSLGKLYTNRFYKSVKNLLKPGGRMAVQSTSPYFAPASYWCVDATLKSAGFHTHPYHCYVPSFGEWGFIMASPEAGNKIKREEPDGLRFYNESVFSDMLRFAPDMEWRKTEINRLNNQALVGYFEKEWSKYIQ